MRPNSDKVLREKIDGLHTLPDGYTPSIDSKWELLQAGMPERKRKFYFVRIAASILLVCGGLLVWVFSSEKDALVPSKTADTNTEITNPAPADMRTESRTKITSAYIPSPVLNNEGAIDPVTGIKDENPGTKYELIVSPHLVAASQKFPDSPFIIPYPFLFQAPVDLPYEADVLKTQNSKPKTRKFVELEFGAPVSNSVASAPKKSIEFRVQIPILTRSANKEQPENNTLARENSNPFSVQVPF